VKRVLTVIGSILIVAGLWGATRGISSRTADAQIIYLVLSVDALAGGWYLLMRSWDRTISGEPRAKRPADKPREIRTTDFIKDALRFWR
jgi:hypothetical protein